MFRFKKESSIPEFTIKTGYCSECGGVFDGSYLQSVRHEYTEKNEDTGSYYLNSHSIRHYCISHRKKYDAVCHITHKNATPVDRYFRNITEKQEEIDESGNKIIHKNK